MKYFGLMLISLIFALQLNAQKRTESKLKNINRSVTSIKSPTSDNLIIWTDDFSNNDNWLISNDEGNSQNWKLTTYNPIGSYSGNMGKIDSESPYKIALMDADFIGNGDAKQRAKLTTAQGIDCSNNKQVFVKFLSYYGKLGSKVYFRVSNDNGISWNDFELHKNLVDWQFSNNPEKIQMDITDYAAGYDNVLIQFYFDGQEDNWGLAWMIDDIEIYEPSGLYAEITSINSYWIMGTSEDFEFSANFQNLGAETINSITFKYKLNDFESQIDTKESLSIEPFEIYNLTHNELYSFEAEAKYTPYIEITHINGTEFPISVQGDYIDAYDNNGKKALLGELFTSSTCAPCAGFNPFYDLVQSFISPTILNTVKYQMDWPENGDPYYTEEGGVRRDYYGVTGVPSLYINGEYVDIYDYGLDYIRNSLRQASSYNVDIEGEVTNTTVEVDINILPSEIMEDAYLFVSVNEKQTHDNTGTNGETDFNHVMHKMLTTASGVNIDDLITNESKTLNYSFDMSTTNMEEFNDLEVVAFIQNKETREVLQSVSMDLSWEESTSSTQETMESSINIYPNPASDYITIDTESKVEVSIFSMTGQAIIPTSDYFPGEGINLSNFTSGIYLVTIIKGYDIEVKKLIISK